MGDLMIAPPVGVKPTTPCVESARCPNSERPQVVMNGKGILEYRAVYAAVHGWAAIKGRIVEHACDNPRCVRYGHLRLGSHATNAQDMIAKGRGRGQFQLGKDVRRGNAERAAQQRAQTHCKWGHEFTDENTYVTKGGRQCRECVRRRKRDFRKKAL